MILARATITITSILAKFDRINTESNYFTKETAVNLRSQVTGNSQTVSSETSIEVLQKKNKKKLACSMFEFCSTIINLSVRNTLIFWMLITNQFGPQEQLY